MTLAFSRTLVTGAAGFIGAAVVERLLARGGYVVGFDNLDAATGTAIKRARLARLTPPHFEFVTGDIVDAEALARAADLATPIDTIVHLAARVGVRASLDDPRGFAETNAVGFTNVLELGRRRQVAHVVYASSSSVYGANREVPYHASQASDHPLSFYAATKRGNELMAHSFSHLYGLPTTGLRLFTVYGPWARPDMALCTFAERMVLGLPIDIFGDGGMQRDFTYRDDVADAIVHVLASPPSETMNGARQPHESSAPFRVLDVGAGHPIAITALIGLLETALGVSAERRYLPMQAGDMRTTWADASALERLVGWRPSVTIEEGVAAFARWYRDVGFDITRGAPR